MANDSRASSLGCSLGWTVGIFIAIWIALFVVSNKFPYLENGSDIIFHAKLRFERQGQIFPPAKPPLRVMIFGDSKTLAGFVPSLFDQLAAAHGQNLSSYNSGFPGTDVFLPQLETICRRGQAPDVLLLTLPWRTDPPRRTIFHLVSSDHDIITALFPFREWLRDLTDFLLTARTHGGIRHLYEESEKNEQKVIADRGYYLITEQSRFPDGRLPDNFHLPSDQPDVVRKRTPPAHSGELDELNRLVQQYHMRCYYVPYYMRIGEYSPAQERDSEFAAMLQSSSSCKLAGPDYLLYPNRYFSDQTHMNTAGARIYTEALYDLLENQLSPGSQHALQ